MPESISNSEKKTTESSYLTVEQIHIAVSAWVEAQSLPLSARTTIYQRAAEQIDYYQTRNQQARMSHTKTTRQRLQAMGIQVDQLPSCVPVDQ